MDTIGRICTKCKRWKKSKRFHQRSNGVLQTRCKRCLSKEYKDPKKWAQAAWFRIYHRLQNKNGNNPSYEKFELRIGRREFEQWCAVTYAEWVAKNPDDKPSVDRKDPHGHYERGNLQILSMVENGRKRLFNKNLWAPPGKSWCRKCSRFRSAKLFGRHPHSMNGLAYNCKLCVSEINRLEHLKRKNRR